MEQYTLFIETDTSAPRTIVPIFYMHEGERAFCTTPGCICHVNEMQLRQMLGSIIDGDLKLRKAFNGMIVGKGIE